MTVSLGDENNLLVPSNGSFQRWSSGTITYYFSLTGSMSVDYPDIELLSIFKGHIGELRQSDSVALTPLQRGAFTAAIAAWESVANVTITFESGGDILVGQVPFPRGNTATARTVNPGQGFSDVYGDLWLNLKATANNDAYFASRGSTGYWIMLHELGHALGLSHGDEDSPASWLNSSAGFNSLRYTVMAYRGLNGAKLPSSTTGAPSRPMLVDIAAIQRLYGANANANVGGDTYKFEFKDSWPIQAIWDAGGGDTIDGGNRAEDLHIDLSRGGESYLAKSNNAQANGFANSTGARVNGQPEIHIAFQPMLIGGAPDPGYAHNYIENAVGGSGDDYILGNDAVNKLEGGDGGDFIAGGLGDDIISGGRDSGPLNGRNRRIDHLEGGIGNDFYDYATSDGQDEILDSDGLGAIRINSTTLAGTFLLVNRSQTGYTKYQSNRVWQTDINGTPVFLVELSGNIQTGATLLVEGAALGADGSITILNFVSDFANRNDLGIRLDPRNMVVFRNPDVDLKEHEAVGVPLDLRAPAKAGDTLVVQMNGPSDMFQALDGAHLHSFVNGAVEIPLAVGQTTVMLSLLSVGDVDGGSQSIGLTAKLRAVDGALAEPSTLNLAFLTVDEGSLTAPPTTYTIQGDKAPFLDNQGVVVLDSWGNTIPIGPEPGRNDEIFDTTASDLIITGDGINRVVGGRGGNDVVTGGSGIDQVLTGDGNDFLVGAGGGDRLSGGGGDDRIFGESEISVDSAILAGRTDTGLAEFHDFLRGADGNDVLIGSAGRDVLSGGAGDDTLIAGAGDDHILGDIDRMAIWQMTPTGPLQWEIVLTITPGGPGGFDSYNYAVNNTNLITSTQAAGNDLIYAGAGNDSVIAGGGDDLVFGESGDDHVFGGVGNDTALGGIGNDSLMGGDPEDTGEDRDFLDGGADDDVLNGVNGDDTLFGGGGNDNLFGDVGNAFAGVDYLNGEDGNDTLVGGGRADTLIGGAGNDSLLGDNGAYGAATNAPGIRAWLSHSNSPTHCAQKLPSRAYPSQ